MGSNGNGAHGRLARLRSLLRNGSVHLPNDVLQSGVFVPCDPLLVTPRDFDLSPYFQVIKPALLRSSGFDYKALHWLSDEGAAGETVTDVPTDAQPLAVEGGSRVG